MNATSFLSGFAAAVLCVAVVFGAAFFRFKRSRGRGRDIKGYLDLIPDLTEAQRAQVREIRAVFLPKVEEIRRNMRSKRARLAELLFEDPVERQTIHAVAKEITEHQAELEKEVIRHILEERELLSPSQNRRFYEIIVEQFSYGGLGVHDVDGGR